MKKRYVIALIITLWILWITNPFWLVFVNTQFSHFEIYIFIIVLICGYLLSLKITEYLADFKNIKHYSRIEIIFLTVFFLLLCFPMSNIDTESTISKVENRSLSKYKSLFKDNYEINYNFGNDFNNWFNDRFNQRQKIIYLYYGLVKYPLSGRWLNLHATIYNKKTHWAFRTKHIFYKEEFYSDNYIKNTVTQLDKFNEFCNENNIKLYVLIIPYNVEVYYEMTSPYINMQALQHKKNSVIYKIIKNTNAKVIYPYKELKQQTSIKQIYYKMDHHLTDDGSYIAYLELMKYIKKDFPQVKIVSLSEYNKKSSRLIRSEWSRKYNAGERIEHDLPFLKIYKNSILDKKYAYYDNKNKKILNTKITNNDKIRKKEFYYPYGSDLKVLQMGSSMNESLTQFTPYSFKNLTYIRLIGVKGIKEQDEFKIMKYYKNTILNYKPDIIILCITPLNLQKNSQRFMEN